VSGRKHMNATLKRLALAGALATTVGGAAPAAITATAAAAPAGATAFPFPDSLAFFPVPGGVAANGQLIVGPTATGAIIISTAPTSFINTNNQTSAVGNWTAGQVLAP
jgi:hypothetical protein